MTNEDKREIRIPYEIETERTIKFKYPPRKEDKVIVTYSLEGKKVLRCPMKRSF